MSKTLIGIVPRTEMVGSNYRVQVNYSYLQPFIERQISTIILSLNDPNLNATLELCDGFLVPGGSDINPIYYHEENNGLSEEIDSSLDKIDQMVIAYAVKNHKPLFGICRGAQSLNVFLGGSLYQDIKSAGLTHEEHDHTHIVDNCHSHPFCSMFKDQLLTNSFHHQSIKDVADGLVVIFKHHDVIEGIHHQTLPIFALQWHPERLSTKDSTIIFDYFVDLVKKNKSC